MAYELILSTDTLDQGRVKINNFVNNSSSLLSTGTLTYSTIRINQKLSTTGDYSFVMGCGNNIIGNDYASILGGSGNTIQAGTFSLITGGKSNLTRQNFGTVINGLNNIAGNYSTVVNGKNNNSRYSYYSFIPGGVNNKAGGDYGNKNFCGGFSNETNGGPGGGGGYFANYSAIVWGKNNRISRQYSFLGGGLNNLNAGIASVIVGGKKNTINTNATYGSILGGRGNRIAHSHSVAFGGGAQTSGPFSIVLGNANTDTPATGNVKFRVDSNGQIYSDASTSITQPADYAEYFEWLDQNPNSEDRKGLFVSLEGEKIVVGNLDIIGIVSATPAFVGDTADLFWKDFKLKNEWGQYLYENYSGFTIKNEREKIIYLNDKNEIYLEPPSGGVIEGIKYNGATINDINFENNQGVFKVHIYNKNFDPNLEYIPRSERKEWSPIGLLGKLLVRTSESITSTKVDAGPDGKAKNGSTYHVLKTVKDFDGDYGIVQILFK